MKCTMTGIKLISLGLRETDSFPADKTAMPSLPLSAVLFIASHKAEEKGFSGLFFSHSTRDVITPPPSAPLLQIFQPQVHSRNYPGSMMLFVCPSSADLQYHPASSH